MIIFQFRHCSLRMICCGDEQDWCIHWTYCVLTSIQVFAVVIFMFNVKSEMTHTKICTLKFIDEKNERGRRLSERQISVNAGGDFTFRTIALLTSRWLNEYSSPWSAFVSTTKTAPCFVCQMTLMSITHNRKRVTNQCASKCLKLLFFCYCRSLFATMTWISIEWTHCNSCYADR